jgi:hypothetical protein
LSYRSDQSTPSVGARQPLLRGDGLRAALWT